MPRTPAPVVNMMDASPSLFARMRDGLVNMVNSLGTQKDPRTSSTYVMTQLSSEQLLVMYRVNWLARRIVDAVPKDSTREWRSWQASEEQIQAIEDHEKKLGVKQKVRQAMVRARLFGGSAIVMGIEGAGNVSEELDLELVKEDSLKFLLVLSSYEMTRGQMISDASDPYFGRPEYYRINTGRADLGDVQASVTDIHPSRVIEFVGADIPSWDVTNGGGIWGDSILQSVDEVLRDYNSSLASVAALISDCKVDIFTIPGLTKQIGNPDYERRLTTRLTVSNQMKSAINAMLMDENETHERIQTQFAGLPPLLSELLKVMCGAAGIPMTRLVGHGAGSGGSSGLGGSKSGGESDLRNYYDDVASDQENELSPRLAPLDEVLERSALGTYDESVYYEWTPLYKPDPSEEATIALTKSQVMTADVTANLINPDVLREVRINQLIEDGFYPGLQEAVDEYGSEPEEPEIGEEDIANHIGMLQQSSRQLQQLGQAAQPALPKPQPSYDGEELRGTRMFSDA